MSNAIFPTLPGLRMTAARTVLAPPVTVRTTPSRREYRARDATLPRYRYKLAFEFLRTRDAFPEMQTLAGFFNARGGSFDSFLFTDPVDSSVTDQVFGTGNGVRTSWPLVRTFGGFVEPLDAVNSTLAVKVNGVATGAVSVSGATITFNAPPAVAAALSWTGTYYRRVRFERDELDVERVLGDIWEGKSVNLISVNA